MTKYADNTAYQDVRHCWDALEAKDALITSQAAEIERLREAGSTAMSDVLAERRRQVEQEGWTPEHDDQWTRGQLAQAASCYADRFPELVTFQTQGYDDEWRPAKQAPRNWPFHPQWWKPTDRRRDLVKAAALILAEIERLDRAALTTGDAHE